MPTIKKYIIKPDNVKNPFQMRATSPLKTNYTELLRSDVSGDKIKAGNITGATSVVAVDAISNKTETGVKSFGKNLAGLDNTDEDATEKKQFNEGLRKRIDSAGNPAKKQRLQNKLERKQIKQGARAEKLKVRGGDQKSKLIERKYNEKNIIKRGLDKTQETDLSVDSKKLKLPKVNSNFDFDAQINKLKLRDEVTPSASAVTGSKESNETTTPQSVPKPPPSGKYNDSSKGNDFTPDFVVSGTDMIRLKPEGLYKQIADYTPKKIKDMSFTEKTEHSLKNYNATKMIKQVNASREFSQRMKDSRDRQKIKKLRPTPLLPTSPVNYSIANPFSPRQQDIVGQVYNPNGNDINQFQDGQAFNKFASNPNTLNEPPIPTEADTTMNDLQMGNEPMGAVFGENLPGALNPRQQRKADRRSRRADRRANRQGGFQNFVRQAVM